METLAILIIWALISCGPLFGDENDVLIFEIQDGDNCWAMTRRGHIEYIRLRGGDARELMQDGGDEDKRALSSIALAKWGHIRYAFKGRYGRTITDLVIGGQDVTVKMIESGNMFAFMGIAKHKAAEAYAKSKKIGVHAAKSMLPKKWRELNKGKRSKKKEFKRYGMDFLFEQYEARKGKR